MTSMTWIMLISAIVLLVVGLLISKVLSGIFRKGLERTLLPELVIDFMCKFLGIVLYVSVFLIFVASLGFDVGSVVLGLSAIIGLILGLGMQDTVSNLVSGIWIAAIRPMDKNDFITVAGSTGTVSVVNIMTTELLTVDNQLITIPNKLIWDSSIVNFTRMPTRRVSVDVGISFKSDLNKAISAAMDLMQAHPKILETPAPAVVVLSLGEFSVNLQLRAWTANSDLWGVKWDLTGGIVQAFAENGIEIPFPQQDVHIKNE